MLAIDDESLRIERDRIQMEFIKLHRSFQGKNLRKIIINEICYTETEMKRNEKQ